MGWNQDWNWNSLGKEEKKDINAGEKAGEGNSIEANRRAENRERNPVRD